MIKSINERPNYTRVLFVVNPKSGQREENNLTHLIGGQAKISGFKYQLYTMSGEDDQENIIQEIIGFNPDIVAAAGGDGTANLMAEILVGTSITLLIIPYGSANGMAKEIGIGTIEAAIDLLESGLEKPIDLLRINNKICIHLADVGINARIVKRFEQDVKRGLTIYAKHLFNEIFLIKHYTFKIEYDGKYMKRKAVSLTFANASKYGTGAVINPKGIIDDGQFEMVIVKPFPHVHLFSIAWKMFFNRLHKSDYVEVIQCKEATISVNKRTTLQVDGEIMGKVKEIKIEILPSALRMLVPKS